jgi:type II secretion system protein N
VSAEATTADLVGRAGTSARALAARLGAGDRRALAWYGAYTVAIFTLCFLVTFPHDLMLQRALQTLTSDTPVRIETGSAGLGWGLRYGVAGLRVRALDGVGEPLVNVEQIEVAPSLLGLLRGTPYPVGLDVSLYGGSLRGTIDPRSASFRVDAAVAEVDLARWTGVRTWVEGSLRGRLQARVTLDGDGRGPAAATGDVAIALPGLALEGGKIRGITVPDLHFGDVHLTGTVKNGRLEVAELVGDGEELDIRGEGNVILRTPLEGSVLNLDLTITPAPAASDGLRMAINLLPGSKAENGARRIAVTGTLARPSLR